MRRLVILLICLSLSLSLVQAQATPTPIPSDTPRTVTGDVRIPPVRGCKFPPLGTPMEP